MNSFMIGECGTPANSTGCSDRALRGAGSDPARAASAPAPCCCELVVAVPGGALEPEALLELAPSPIPAEPAPSPAPLAQLSWAHLWCWSTSGCARH